MNKDSLGAPSSPPRHFVIRIDSFEGRDTHLRCGNKSQDFLFAVIALDERGIGSIVDSGYRTRLEAEAAWNLCR